MDHHLIPQKPHKPRHGFTLLELSVVLIIIALLIGGTLLTRSLIRQAKLQEVLREYDMYAKAIGEFRDKYHALPGDMSTATNIWGTSGTGCPNSVSATSPQVATCNGDGDGRIGSSDVNGNVSRGREWWQAWQHLSNAGLIDGRYNGAYGAVEGDAVLGSNVPASKLSPGGWTLLYYLFTNATAAYTWADHYGHILSFGVATDTTGFTRIDASSVSAYNNNVLSGPEALGIDQKIDDGKPALGNVRAWAAPSGCVIGAAQATATYATDLSTGKNPCSLFFILGF